MQIAMRRKTLASIFDNSNGSSEEGSSTTQDNRRNSQYSETELPSMLSQCIRLDNCSRFRSLLRKQIVDVNAVIEGEGTLLHNAAFKGWFIRIKKLKN